MWFTYTPEVKAVIRLLELLKVRVSRHTVDKTLQEHPDWPSLLCISDSLHQWHISNAAAEMDPGQIDELPVPFLAYLPHTTTPLSVVTVVSPDNIVCYTGNYTKPLVQKREEFLKQWQGLYLLAEVNEKSGEKNYRQSRRKAFAKQLLPISFLALLLTGSLYMLHTTKLTHPAAVPAAVYVQFFILLFGIVISALLLWYELDRNNPLLHKVCGSIAQGNCGVILTGRASTFFGLFSWSEAGFIYFTGGLLILLFVPWYIAMPVLGWLHLLAMPYIFFSVYYQWRIAKQWCVLCLAVQALLLAGGLNVLLNTYPLFLQVITTRTIAAVATLYLLPALVWYAIKPVLKKLQQAKNDKRQYLRLKFNIEVFETLLDKQKRINAPLDGLGIVLGNPHAKHELVKVCNPYCGPCAKAHIKLEKILEDNQNVKVRIVFTASNDESDYRLAPVKHLMAIASLQNYQKTKNALNDWYLAKRKNYNTFFLKHPVNGELKLQSGKIEEMFQWCLQTDIKETPTIFINGKRLPREFDIEDISYFLAE